MRSSDRLIVALGAFAGGIAIGLLFAPADGNRTRRITRLEARRGGRWLGNRLRETQHNILDAGDQATDHLKEAAAGVAEKYASDLLGADADWQDVYTQTAKDVEDEKR